MAEAVPTRKVTVGCPSCGQLNRVNLARAKDRPKCGRCDRPLPLDRPIAVTDATLERVIRDAEIPVLVDFYADWCGPCKIMAPVLDQIARDRMGQVLVAKLDTDRNPSMAARYDIRGIPNLVLFRDGREFARQVGAAPRARLEQMLDGALSSAP